MVTGIPLNFDEKMLIRQNLNDHLEMYYYSNGILFLKRVLHIYGY